MKVVINISPDGWSAIEGRLDRVVHRVTEDIADDARRGAPVDSGEMVGTIESEHGAGSSKVWVRTDHWAPTEYGSRPHVISAGIRASGKQGALLWPGARHPVRSVNHPGTPAQPFMRPALYRARVIAGIP